MAIEKTQDNVLDIKQDEKLKLQLEIKGMLDDLKTESDQKTLLKGKFDNLLHKGNITRQELTDTQQDIKTIYTQAKGGVDQTESIKNIDQAIDNRLTNSLKFIDDKAEVLFNQWIFTADKNKTPDQLENDFSNFAKDIVKQINEQILTTEEMARMTYKFELKNLQQRIYEVQYGVANPWDPVKHPGAYDVNPSVNGDAGGTTQNSPEQNIHGVDIPDYRNLYKDTYNTTSVLSDAYSKTKSYDIYKKDRMNEVMKKILDVDNELKLSNGTFAINLSAENGFAGVLSTIGGKNGKTNIGGYEFLVDTKSDSIRLINTPDGYREDGKITADDLKKMVDKKLIRYEHDKGLFDWDNELAKIATLMNKVPWSDLSTFVALSDAKSDQAAVLKEYVNAKENKGLCTPETVFDFLCDKDGDGYVGNSNDKQKNKNIQKDVGNIFGPQLKWSIDQASKVETALHDPEGTTKSPDGTTYGERVVIKNIITNIDIQDNRFASIVSNKQKATALYQELALYTKPENCTKTNLAATIVAYPEFKVFFGAAIEKINGGSSIITPDLADNLTGNTINRFMESGNWQFRKSLEQKIDADLLKKYGKTEIDDTVIKTRENLITKIMNIADGFTIIGSDTQEGYLRNPGVTKEFADKQAKEAFINDLTTKTLSSIAIGALSGENTIRIPVDFIKQGHSESGRTLWKVQAGPSVGYNRETQDIVFTLGAGGEVAEQYNYSQVINAPLDEVKSAQYIGVEGKAIAGASLKNLNIGAEASIGVMWEKDPVMGINQINRQYENVSKRIFRVSKGEISSYQSIYDALERRVNGIDDNYKNFVSTNKKRLLSNADFIVSFLSANKVLETTQDPKAINELISMLQEGTMEEWRSDLLNNLNGKIDITKLAFGVTTNMLSLSYQDGKRSATNGDMSQQNLNQATALNSVTTPGTKYTFGIAGFYIGARITNWRTTYGINSRQLANSRYEIAEGKNTDQVSLKNRDQYAKYLTAMFNKTDKYGVDQIKVEVVDNKLVISNTSGIKLPKLLNIRVTEAAMAQIKYDSTNDILTIGDVKDIGAYTTAQADGVVRQLIIGSKNYKEGSTVNLFNTDDNNPDEIQMTETGKYQPISQADIIQLTEQSNNGITNPFASNAEAKSAFISCFENGQLKPKDPDNVSIIRNKEGSADYNTVSAGKLIVFRKVDNKYTLSLETNTNPNTIGVRFIDGKNFINGQKLNFTKTIEQNDNVDFVVVAPEIKNTIKALEPADYVNLDSFVGKDKKRHRRQAFIDFMNAKTIDAAATQLLKLLPSKNAKFTEIRNSLQNSDAKTKYYIVDQFKGLFAYESIYNNKPMSWFLDTRKNNIFLEALKTGSDELNKEILEIRKTALLNNTDTYNTANRKEVPNLFGFTTFYKTRVDKQASLVSAGDTKVMEVKGALYTPIKNNIEVAKNRTINKLNEANNAEQKNLLFESIKANIKDPSVLSELTSEHFTTLLKTGELVLPGSLKKIKLGTSPVFYFKGECMNESLGLVVDNVEIQESPIQNIEIQKEKVIIVNSRSRTVGSHSEVQTNNTAFQGSASKENVGKVVQNITHPDMNQQNLNEGSAL